MSTPLERLLAVLPEGFAKSALRSASERRADEDEDYTEGDEESLLVANACADAYCAAEDRAIKAEDALAAATKERDEARAASSTESWTALHDESVSRGIEIAKLREALEDALPHMEQQAKRGGQPAWIRSVEQYRALLSAPAPKLKKVWVTIDEEGALSRACYFKSSAKTLAKAFGETVVPAYMEVSDEQAE